MKHIYAEFGPAAVAGMDGYIFGLTACCRASATLKDGEATCRACLGNVPEHFAMSIPVTRDRAAQEVAWLLADIAEEMICQDHMDKARFIVSKEASRQRHPSRSGAKG